MKDERMGDRDVLAIITSFNPCYKLKELVDTIWNDPSISTIAIYDNNSTKGTEVLREIEDTYREVNIVWSSSNDGLGIAYNHLIEKYLNKEKFIITFDQDSQIESMFVSSLKTSLIRENAHDIKVMSIGPRIVSVDNNKVKFESEIKRKPVLITSGNLFFTNMYTQVGGFDEELFIDCLDYDFSLKIRKQGFLLIQDRSICLFQNIGDKVNGERFHSDLRMYYMMRNHIRLTRRYLFQFPMYIVFEDLMFIKYLFRWKRHVDSVIFKNIIKKAIREA